MPYDAARQESPAFGPERKSTSVSTPCKHVNSGRPLNDALDLAVQGLGRTRLAKSVHDAGWSSFVGMLEYKARLYGREFHRIGRFTPTSQTCSACGVKDGPRPLHVRAWQCLSCGVWLDRDINAAVNVARAAGLAVTACRAQVRPGASPPAQRSEAGTPRGAA